MRKRLLQNSEVGGGSHTLNLMFSGTGPIDTSAWIAPNSIYTIEDGRNIVLDDIPMETYRSCGVESGTYYIAPKGPYVDRIVYNGSSLNIYFNDAQGNPIINNPQGTITISGRPGESNISYYTGNNSQFIQILIDDDIVISSKENTRLICIPQITIGDFYFQFFLYA